MNSTHRVLRWMTHINIGASLALMAWMASHGTPWGGL
jgi:hypothetical protein